MPMVLRKEQTGHDKFFYDQILQQLIYAIKKSKCFFAGYSSPFSKEHITEHMKFIGKIDLSLLRDDQMQGGGG